MKKKSSKDLGASAKKPSRVAGAPSPKKAKDLRFDRSRKINPSKSERHSIYKEMLSLVADLKYGGFCLVLDRMGYKMMGYIDGLRGLPELLKSRPDVGIGAHWWSPYEQGERIEALKKSIAATAPRKRVAIAIGKASRKAGSVAKRKSKNP